MSIDLRSVPVLVPASCTSTPSRHRQDLQAARHRQHRPGAGEPELRDTVRGVAASPAIGGSFVGADFLRALPHVEIVANFGVGYDGVDAAFAGGHGIMVTNTPDVLTEEVADTALALLLATVRELPRAERWLRDGDWVRKGNFRLSPLTLRGRRVGIFGLGRIGLAVAHRLKAFGVQVSYHNGGGWRAWPMPITPR